MLADLPKAVAVYQNGCMSLDQFEDWFRTNSRGMFGESPEVLEACLSIDAAFSELRYGVMTQQDFDQELATAVRPFEATENRDFGRMEIEALWYQLTTALKALDPPSQLSVVL
jgi:hypothetical protein